MKKKIIIFRANFGNYDDLSILKDYENKDCEYVCFTDNYIKTKKKKFLLSELKIENYLRKININIKKKLSYQDLNRIIKIYPFELFPNYELYIYIDSHISIKSSLNTLIRKKSIDWLSPTHRFSDNLIDELCACYINNKITYDEFRKFYRNKKNFLQYTGMMENGFILRRNNIIVKKISKIWLKKYLQGPRRDQLHLVNIPEIKKINIMRTSWKINSRSSPLLIYSHYVPAFKKFKNRVIKILRTIKLNCVLFLDYKKIKII